MSILRVAVAHHKLEKPVHAQGSESENCMRGNHGNPWEPQPLIQLNLCKGETTSAFGPGPQGDQYLWNCVLRRNEKVKASVKKEFN